MKRHVKSGYYFGITSAVITTLGLMVGLTAGTRSPVAVIGGIAALAIADGLSESTAMHVSKKSEKGNRKEALEMTFANLLSKILITLTFAIPVLFFNLQEATILDFSWGMLLTFIVGYFASPKQRWEKWIDIAQHLALVIFIVIVSYFTGDLVRVLYV